MSQCCNWVLLHIQQVCIVDIHLQDLEERAQLIKQRIRQMQTQRSAGFIGMWTHLCHSDVALNLQYVQL